MSFGCGQDEIASAEGDSRGAGVFGGSWYVWLSKSANNVKLNVWVILFSSGTVKDVFVENGLRGFYRGLGPTILGYLPTWAIYFAVYDGIKTAFGETSVGMQSAKPNERLYPAAQVKGYQPVAREHPWTLHILSAMTAGAASTICTNPLWVIKTRFMVCKFFLLF